MSSSPEAVEKVCADYINGKSEANIALSLAKDISISNIDLLVVVEALGSWLTSKDVDHRAQGTKLLSEVLTQSTNHTYSSSEVQYLVMFYCDRLKDSATVTPYVLQGLLAIVSHQVLSDTDVVLIIRTIFKEIHNQSLPHGSRRMVYSLCKRFLLTHVKAVDQISSEFLLGYVQAMDGEKDPRNLLIVYDTIPLITSRLDISVLVEDLFEVIACYFPINFTPSPKDPDAISKEELVNGLRAALTSTAQFAEFLMPMLLEKLSSDLHGSKIDSLETIMAGASSFGSIGMGPYLLEVWESIRKEVIQSVSEKVEMVSLSCLTAIVSSISDSPALQHELSTRILKDCSHHLVGSESTLFKSSTRLLLASATGSPTMYTAITESIFPVFIKQLKQDIQSYKKVAILKIVKDFIEIRRSLKSLWSMATPSLDTLLQSLYPSVLSFFNTDVPSSPSAALAVMNEMLLVKGLSADEVGMGCADLLRMAFETDDSEIREQCGLCFKVIGQSYTTVALEFVLPPLLTRLCQNGVGGTGVVTVAMIAAVSTHYDVMVASIPVLLDLLSTLSQESLSDGKVTLCLAVINAVMGILETSAASDNVLQYFSDRVVPHILSAFITSTLTDNSVLSSPKVLACASSVIRLYTSSINQRSIFESFVSNVIDAFSSGSLDTLLPHHRNNSTTNFQPLKASSPWQQTQLISFITAVISPTQVIQSLTSQELFVSLVHFAMESMHPLSVDHASKGCGCIANRMNEASLGVIRDKLESVWSLTSNIGNNEMMRRNGLTLIQWICKGLLLRSHELALTYTQKLLTLFEDKALGESVAAGFQYPILSDIADCLNEECKANIRLFHKQWYFSKMVPQLLSLYHSCIPVRSHTITVLSVLMQSIPKQVLLTELPKLLPLLLESLNPSSSPAVHPDVLVSSLTAIHSLVEDAPSIIGSHVTSLVPHLLNISRTHLQMRVRIQSLRCLGILTVLPTHIIYPLQGQVIRQLSYCIDDKKRLVRKEAVDSRNQWYMIGVE